MVRAFGQAEWFDRGFFAAMLGVAALFAAGAVWLALDASDAIKAITVGVPGTVTVRKCTLSTATKDPQFWTSGWDCTGVFTATDGGLRIDRIKMFMHADDRPGPLVAARVSGPGAGWAVAHGDHEWVFAVLGAAGFPVLAAVTVREAIDVIAPLKGWPRPRRVRPAVPQMGNRARRRRRRR